MSRSVSIHPYSHAIVYLHLEIEDSWDHTLILDDINDSLRDKFPTLRPVHRWAGRENLIVAENEHAEVSVAEYNGIVSVCLAPLDPDNEHDQVWCDEHADLFKATLHEIFPTAALISKGRASNGEQFFAPLNSPDGLVTSKEGVLW